MQPPFLLISCTKFARKAHTRVRTYCIFTLALNVKMNATSTETEGKKHYPVPRYKTN